MHMLKKLIEGNRFIVTCQRFMPHVRCHQGRSAQVVVNRSVHTGASSESLQAPPSSLTMPTIEALKNIAPNKDTSTSEPGKQDEFDKMLTFKDVTVKELLQEKQGSSQVLTISQDETVFEAIRIMAEKNIGALIVVSSGDKTDQSKERGEEEGNMGQGEPKYMVGIMSERDYMNKVVLHGLSSKNIPVSTIMTRNPVCVSLDTTAGQCMRLITNHRIRHLPVCVGPHKDDKHQIPIGLISIGDVLKHVLSEQKETISFLRQYINRENYM